MGKEERWRRLKLWLRVQTALLHMLLTMLLMLMLLLLSLSYSSIILLMMATHHCSNCMMRKPKAWLCAASVGASINTPFRSMR